MSYVWAEVVCRVSLLPHPATTELPKYQRTVESEGPVPAGWFGVKKEAELKRSFPVPKVKYNLA